MHSRRVALGVKVDWAYAPGEVKILTSSDGANFEEAKCWQTSTRPEAAYEESFMFDAPRNVKAVTIAMQAPQSWGYFGINSVSLIAEPGPLMLVRKACSFALFASDAVCCIVALQVALHQQRVSNALLLASWVLVWSPVWKRLRPVMEGRSCSLMRRARFVNVVVFVIYFVHC